MASYEREVDTAVNGLAQYALEPNNSGLRKEVVDYLREEVGDNVDQYRQISSEMQRLGILGELALTEFGSIDGLGKGNSKDGKISVTEANLASQSSDPMMRLAGDFYSKYRQEVLNSDSGNWWEATTNLLSNAWVVGGLFKDSIEEGEVKAYNESQHDNPDGLLSDINGFGDSDNEWNNRDDDDDDSGDGDDDDDDDEDSGDSDDDHEEGDASVNDDKFKDMDVEELTEYLSNDRKDPADRLRAAWELAREHGKKVVTLENGDDELTLEISTDSNGNISLWSDGVKGPVMKGTVRDGEVVRQDSSYFGSDWLNKHGRELFD